MRFSVSPHTHVHFRFKNFAYRVAVWDVLRWKKGRLNRAGQS